MITKQIHIDEIKAGDTVKHNGKVLNVGQKDIKHGFMGTTLFGDSYRLGSIPVTKVLFPTTYKGITIYR